MNEDNILDKIGINQEEKYTCAVYEILEPKSSDQNRIYLVTILGIGLNYDNATHVGKLISSLYESHYRLQTLLGNKIDIVENRNFFVLCVPDSFLPKNVKESYVKGNATFTIDQKEFKSSRNLFNTIKKENNKNVS